MKGRTKRPLPSKALAVLVALMAMAPTAGNIGSCGQEAVPLDAEKFFEAKRAIDCARCSDCPVFSKACTVAPAANWKSSEAYYSYSSWAQGSGYKPMALGMFSRDMEKRFAKVKRKDANYFVGIKGR